MLLTRLCTVRVKLKIIAYKTKKAGVPIEVGLLLILGASVPYCRYIRPEQKLNVTMSSTGCSGQPEQHVAFLEHVVVRVLIVHPRRGDLEISLISPSGTRSQLLAKRWVHYSYFPMPAKQSFLIITQMFVIEWLGGQHVCIIHLELGVWDPPLPCVCRVCLFSLCFGTPVLSLNQKTCVAGSLASLNCC